MRPRIAITLDVRVEDAGSTSPRTYHSGSGYGDAVAAAGGLPLWVGHDVDALPAWLGLADAWVLTGGGDPDTSAFDEPTHAEARAIDPRRQAFELALLDALASPERAATPVLGVCLGMQLMALHAGGRLDQHMPDSMGAAAAAHAGFRRHGVVVTADTAMLPSSGARREVVSSHRQRVTDPGSLAVVAEADDGTIEAVADASRPWRLGVQWHAERMRGFDDPLGWGLFQALVGAGSDEPRP